MKDKSITQHGRKLFFILKMEMFLSLGRFFLEDNGGFYEDSVLLRYVHLHVSRVKIRLSVS